MNCRFTPTKEASTMLTITSQAQNVIRRVSVNPNLESSSGVRVASRPDPAAPMQVGIVQAPHVGDIIFDTDGGRLYMDPAAAQRTEGRKLDAVTDPRGRTQFVLRDAA